MESTALLQHHLIRLQKSLRIGVLRASASARQIARGLRQRDGCRVQFNVENEACIDRFPAPNDTGSCPVR